MKNTKLITTLMTSAMILSSIIPAFATEKLDLSQNFVGQGETAVTYDSTPSLGETDMYLISIPKNIDMGNKKTATYEVGVAGHLTDVSVTITPAATFEMINSVNPDKKVTATVTQEDTDWAASELTETVSTETTTDETGTHISYSVKDYAMHQGTISAPDLTDGVWNGTLTFTIGIK